MIGKNLSHYKILEELGRGGMGVVYKAEDTKLDRTVAIKVLPSAALASEDDRARFYREARAAASLTHPHIAVVYEVDEAGPEGSEKDDLRPFIAMEFIEGETLDAKIKKGPLKLEDAVRIASEIASGLEAAHEKNIVHRDIKSGNVMLTAKGEAKILDFGLAQTAQSTKLTRMGSTLGTVSYMSPEQARVEEVDGRTDLWSLGVVLYEMITGKLPFGAEYEQAVIYGILNEDPEPPTALRTGIPLELERVVFKCLAKDAERRYQHADDLIADLGGIDLKAVQQQTTTFIPEAQTTLTKPLWPYAVGCAVGALIVAVGFLLFAPESGDQHIHAASFQRLTIEPQADFWPTIHPNGDRVAYSSIVDGQFQLFHRSIDGGPPAQIVTGFDGSQRTPAYSPDGTQIVFESRGSIFTVAALGGVPRPVARPRPGEEDLEFPAWSPDGRKLAATTQDDSLFIINLDTGTRSGLVHILEPHSPAWSSEGDYIALVSGNDDHARLPENTANSALWLVQLEDGQVTQLTSGRYMDLSPRWRIDDSGLLFISSEGGGADLRFLPMSDEGRAEGPSQRVTAGLGLHSFQVSNDGKKIVATHLDYSQNVWKSPMIPGVTVSAEDGIPVTQGNQVIEGIALSKDGSKLAYDSNIRGSTQIFTMPAEGGDPLQITSALGPNFVYSWSPSGNELAYHRFDGGIRNVYTISLDVFDITPISAGPLHERYPTWSYDENRLGFTRNQGSMNDFIEATRDSTGTWIVGETIVTGINVSARFSPLDGRLLYSDQNGIYIKESTEADPIKVVDGDSLNIRSVRWSADASTIYFMASSLGESDKIWSKRIIGDEAQQVLRFDGVTRGFVHFVIGEGEIFYSVKERQSDIWVINLDE